MVNGVKFQSPTVTLTLIRQCPLSNLSEIFSYATPYSNFMFLDRLLFELSSKNTHKHTHTHTDAHTQRFGRVKRNYNKVRVAECGRREETIGPCPCPRWGHPWRLNTFITKIIIIIRVWKQTLFLGMTLYTEY